MRGMFIVLYGINNIGKTTQAHMLCERLKKEGVPVEYVKYPVYDLEPTGPRLNRILRHGEEPDIHPRDLQDIYARNRRDFEPQLRRKLREGIWVVAEDYTGTGIAWGMSNGVSLTELERINEGLLREDIAILLDGERFLKAREERHLFESRDRLAKESRRIHRQLARRYGWEIMDVRGDPAVVHAGVWGIVEPHLSRPQ